MRGQDDPGLSELVDLGRRGHLARPDDLEAEVAQRRQDRLLVEEPAHLGLVAGDVQQARR